MIRRFEERDTERVMRIWLEGNLGAHDFIPGTYWRAQYAQVQEQLAQAEVLCMKRMEIYADLPV